MRTNKINAHAHKSNNAHAHKLINAHAQSSIKRMRTTYPQSLVVDRTQYKRSGVREGVGHMTGTHETVMTVTGRNIRVKRCSCCVMNSLLRSA